MSEEIKVPEFEIGEPPVVELHGIRLTSFEFVGRAETNPHDYPGARERRVRRGIGTDLFRCCWCGWERGLPSPGLMAASPDCAHGFKEGCRAMAFHFDHCKPDVHAMAIMPTIEERPDDSHPGIHAGQGSRTGGDR